MGRITAFESLVDTRQHEYRLVERFMRDNKERMQADIRAAKLETFLLLAKLKDTGAGYGQANAIAHVDYKRLITQDWGTTTKLFLFPARTVKELIND